MKIQTAKGDLGSEPCSTAPRKLKGMSIHYFHLAEMQHKFLDISFWNTKLKYQHKPDQHLELFEKVDYLL